jgi:hypothetical protein
MDISVHCINPSLPNGWLSCFTGSTPDFNWLLTQNYMLACSIKKGSALLLHKPKTSGL